MILCFSFFKLFNLRVWFDQIGKFMPFLSANAFFYHDNLMYVDLSGTKPESEPSVNILELRQAQWS